MALLRGAAAALFVFITACGSAAADFLPVVQSVDLMTNDSAGGGSIYNLGVSLVAGLGRSDDPANRSGEFHFTYARQYSPIDPTDPASDLKHINNYQAGVSAVPFGEAVMGVDLDSASDRYEQFFTNGVKATVGYGPLKLSYRYASNVLQQTMTLPSEVKVGDKTVTENFEFIGAEIYQQTLGLQAALDPTRDDSVTLSLEGSRFGPNAVAFAFAIQNEVAIASLSTFSDSLQSFEQYAYDALWKHVFHGTKYDSTFECRFSHEIITANTLTDIRVAFGYKVSEAFHVQAGWEYTHDATQTQNLGTIELRASWDRSGAAPSETEQGTFKGLPRSQVSPP